MGVQQTAPFLISFFPEKRRLCGSGFASSSHGCLPTGSSGSAMDDSEPAFEPLPQKLRPLADPVQPAAASAKSKVLKGSVALSMQRQSSSRSAPSSPRPIGAGADKRSFQSPTKPPTGVRRPIPPTTPPPSHLLLDARGGSRVRRSLSAMVWAIKDNGERHRTKGKNRAEA